MSVAFEILLGPAFGTTCSIRFYTADGGIFEIFGDSSIERLENGAVVIDQLA